MPARRPPRLVLVALLGALTACTLPVQGEFVGGDGGGSATLGRDPDGTVLSAEDGFVPDGGSLSPFADLPALSNLEPGLRSALQAAARAAADDGVDLHVTSGWRSAAYQQSLFDSAVRTYGSAEEARAFVLRPDESEHVTGEAVDIGPTDATSWMSQHGADHGLCQTYANEPWHYELRTRPGGTCPPPLVDARAG